MTHSKSLGLLALVTAALGIAAAAADEVPAQAHYLGNSSVMVSHGATKIIFDPLFRNDYGQYERVPADIEQALFAGDPPWDSIDAVFISHNHEDHFDTTLMLSFLEARADIDLYAPEQAVADLKRVASAGQQPVFERVHAVTPEYGATPTQITLDGLQIEAVRVPHSGWPERMTDIENIAFRVTLEGATTVLHVGDADPRLQHFSSQADHWNSRHTHLALPPYWFFLSPDGRRVIAEQLRPEHAIGIHVPRRMPDDPAQRPDEFSGFDLFTQPGETRAIKAD